MGKKAEEEAARKRKEEEEEGKRREEEAERKRREEEIEMQNYLLRVEERRRQRAEEEQRKIEERRKRIESEEKERLKKLQALKEEKLNISSKIDSSTEKVQDTTRATGIVEENSRQAKDTQNKVNFEGETKSTSSVLHQKTNNKTIEEDEEMKNYLLRV